MKFVVLGSGAWGTAVAVHLAHCQHETFLIPRSDERAREMRQANENTRYLPHIPFPALLHVETELGACISNCDALFLACPVKGLQSACELLKQVDLPPDLWIISLIKGMDRLSLKRPSELIRGYFPSNHLACLSGPTRALEFAMEKPAAMVLASSYDHTERLQAAISNDNVRIYRSTDLVGVEIGSCLKNIYALGAGILDGLNLGDNAKAAYLTRALKEMSALGCALGGQRESFYGLSGLGDLIATAQGSWSRNRIFGERFARGESVELLTKELTVEGYWTLEGYDHLVCDKHLDAPILRGLYEVVYEKCPVEETIHHLMMRPLRYEF